MVKVADVIQWEDILKSKIKQITLIDGKQLFYPSEEEVRKLDNIASLVIEESLTKDEYDYYYSIYPDGTLVREG